MRLAGHAAELSGVAQCAVGGSAISLGLSAEALCHLQLAARLSGAGWRWRRAQIAAWVTGHRLGSSPDARGAAGAGRGDKVGSGR